MPAKNPRTKIETSLHGQKFGLTKHGDLVLKGGDNERIIAGVRPASTVELFDDFLGDVIASNWNVRKGSDPQCVDFAFSAMVNGAVRATTGDDAAATMAVNGVQLESSLNWQASEGGLFFETRIKVDLITAVSIFVGLTDQAAALEAPTPHRLRNNYATALMKAEIDDRTIADAMGWAIEDVPEMRRVYVDQEAIVGATIIKLREAQKRG